jgi:hypothetical protein
LQEIVKLRSRKRLTAERKNRIEDALRCDRGGPHEINSGGVDICIGTHPNHCIFDSPKRQGGFDRNCRNSTYGNRLSRLCAPGTNPGTLLADLVEPFSTTVGTSGVLNTAVFQESGGTLDFYYQVENNAGSIDSLARETDTNFTGFTTSTGFRVDGSTLPGGFVDGTVVPVTADRNGPGDVVGFSFNPPDSAKIPPGSTSNVFVISTDATHFTNGTASLIDGGTTTIKAFEPQSAVPEPSELMVMALGLITLVALQGRRA